MAPRQTATWMQLLDERILEFLNSEGWASISMMQIAIDLDASQGRIEERCEELLWMGLIDCIHGDMYELTGLGMRYLEGKLDAEHLPIRPIS